MRLAVAGAGIQGVTIALELARRGHAVDLYEREAAPLGRASSSNEGKLHLGFVYGNDPSYRTVKIVLKGSTRFSGLLNRWLPFSADTVPFSEPFQYAVHRETMVPAEALATHFSRVSALYRAESEDPEARYLGLAETFVCEPLHGRELAKHFDTDVVVAAYRTNERSIDPRALAALLRAAVLAEPRIRLHASHTVTRAAARDDGRVALEIEHEGTGRHEVYDRVVNACWEGRLALDASFGVKPARAWLHRFKLGAWITTRGPALPVPSVTVVLGPFGDIANFGSSKIYLSWYPDCLIGSSAEPTPPDWNAGLTEGMRAEVVRKSMLALGRVVPSLRALDDARIERIECVGGVIFAWGRSDIDDPASELHRRDDIGVQSYGNYHSVNTGRYCAAPLFALETCDRMLGAR